MKKLFIVFITAILLISNGTAHASEAASITRTVSPIAAKLLELMRSNDRDLSLGAMLVSVDVNDYSVLESFVRENLSESDEPWVKAVKLYTISRYTLDDGDAVRFIQSIPEDKDNFWKLINFECGVTRHPGSKILDHLLYYARTDNNQELLAAAVHKLDRLQPCGDGWVGEYIRPIY